MWLISTSLDTVNKIINLTCSKPPGTAELPREKAASIGKEISPAELVIDKLAQDEQLARIRALTTEQEWRILCSLSQDRDYKTVAQDESISVDALKAKMSRCRSRLKERLAA